MFQVVFDLKNGQLQIYKKFQAGLCGSISGAIAGALTTPLDVAKTRIMLAPASARSSSVRRTLAAVFAERGVRGVFAGLLPRITSFALGGAIFLGAYDYATAQCNALFAQPNTS